jgi:hypothetical protein
MIFYPPPLTHLHWTIPNSLACDYWDCSQAESPTCPLRKTCLIWASTIIFFLFLDVPSWCVWCVL